MNLARTLGMRYGAEPANLFARDVAPGVGLRSASTHLDHIPAHRTRSS